MLMENTLLLLLATRFLQAELRNSLCLTGAVMSGSLVGKVCWFSEPGLHVLRVKVASGKV